MFFITKNVLEFESRISLCAIGNKVTVDVFLWFCYCQSDFTVFVTKLLIRQFTLLIYIFTNHYQSITRSLIFWAPLALALIVEKVSAARARAHQKFYERRSRSRSSIKRAPLFLALSQKSKKLSKFLFSSFETVIITLWCYFTSIALAVKIHIALYIFFVQF